MTEYPISQNNMLTVGKILSTRREELGRSILEIAEQTKIQKHYLELIEADDFEKFDNEIFLLGFIKNYATALGLNTEKIVAIYRRTVKRSPKKTIPIRDTTIRDLNISSRFVIGMILSASVLAVFLFLMLQLYNFQKVPQITIITPENDVTVDTTPLEIKGLTDVNSIVQVNGNSIEINNDGTFQVEVDLVPGTNTISIRTSKENNVSKESVKVLTVIYEPKEEVVEEKEPEVEEVVVTDSIKVQISGGDAWVQTIVDGSQVTGEILPNGYEQSFTIKETFELITGVPSVTKVFINNLETPVQIPVADGIGTLTCSLESTSVICDN